MSQELSSHSLNFGILTISDTRTQENDKSGVLLQKLITSAGHQITHYEIIKDDISVIRDVAKSFCGIGESKRGEVLICTGGTGLTARDLTPEALEPILDKKIPGFGELFRMLSYQKIATSTIQSRVFGGIINQTYVFALPGSPNACKDAWEFILKDQFNARTSTCNFVDLMPRL